MNVSIALGQSFLFASGDEGMLFDTRRRHGQLELVIQDEWVPVGFGDAVVREGDTLTVDGVTVNVGYTDEGEWSFAPASDADNKAAGWDQPFNPVGGF